MVIALTGTSFYWPDTLSITQPTVQNTEGNNDRIMYMVHYTANEPFSHVGDFKHDKQQATCTQNRRFCQPL